MMEHRCQSCGFALFDNDLRGLTHCPKCGNRLSHYFDEDIRIERDEPEAADPSEVYEDDDPEPETDYDETSYHYEPEERS